MEEAVAGYLLQFPPLPQTDPPCMSPLRRIFSSLLVPRCRSTPPSQRRLHPQRRPVSCGVPWPSWILRWLTWRVTRRLGSFAVTETEGANHKQYSSSCKHTQAQTLRFRIRGLL